MNLSSWHRARRLLCELHDHLRESVVRARRRQLARFAEVSGVTSADTIYHVDRISETAVKAWFARHWPRAWPVHLVMEGLEDGGALTTFPPGLSLSEVALTCILDPIDGTRGLMHDKRSAWILTGLAARPKGREPHLGDIRVGVMTELPTSKQEQSDQFSAVRGQGVMGRRWLGEGRRPRPLLIRPSRARDFEHGFVSFARFFPEAKTWLADLEENLWKDLGLWGKDGGARVFEDQYISTGGQLYELMVGHDRMVADLRPQAFTALNLPASGLSCHPYDICTAFLLEEVGGIVETPEGKPLRSPLDTTTPVAWVGYANAHLARQVRPVLRALLARRGR
ncbi:MAG: inositol monophosphatase [Opitutaceae bacterium]